MIVYSEPVNSERLPVIDLSGALCGDPEETRRVVDSIRAAAQDTGFFYVSNHGVNAAIVDAAFAAAGAFFDQSLEHKDALRKVNGSGYEPIETQRLDNASPADLKESFSIDPAPNDPAVNQWPAVHGFREALEAYAEGMLALGLTLSRLIARSLFIDEHFFDGPLSCPAASLRLLRYMPQPANAAFNQLGAGAHTDWGWITLLAQDGLGGLEVQNSAGTWIRATPIPDTFVINLGDLVARWTNGRYHSNMHRVLNNRSGKDRHSIVLFYNPSGDTMVECLPTCLEPGEIPAFPPCTAGAHLAQRYRESRPQLES
jgi:isopenicillin N synthase-like dioxygenase